MLSALLGPATQLLDKFVEDKDKKNELAHEIATMAERHAQELAKGQLDINKEEANTALSSLAVGDPSWAGHAGLLCVTILS
jgi:hypothetical protein